MISFAGINSDEKYVVVEHYPQRIFPKRKYSIVSVPGRSGDIYLDEGYDAFENYDQNYSVFIDAKAPGLPQVSRGLAEWLLGNPGYQRLEDSYDPDFFRMAVYISGEGFLNIFNEYGRGTMTFNCNPKRFYKSGEQEIEISTKNTKIYSPSSFKSKPIFIVETKGTGGSDRVTVEVYVNGRTFRAEQVFGTLTIDTERHSTYKGETNYNSYIKSNYEELYLDPVSTISWSNQVNSVKIIPRWWTI